MSRKSNFPTKLAFGVSIFAIASSICWFAGIDEVHAGSLRIKSSFARAGISKVSGLKQTTKVNSRAIRRFADPRNRFQASQRLKVRSLNKTTAARRFKSVAPTRGNQRLAIGNANRIRLQKLNTANRTRKFGRIVNIGSVSNYKDNHTSQKVMTGYVKVPDIAGESKRGKDDDTEKSPLAPVGTQIAPSQAPRKVSPSKVRGVFSKKLLMTGLSNDAKLKGEQKFPKITRDNGIRFGAHLEFESSTSAVIPERNRLVFLKLLDVPVRPAAPLVTLTDVDRDAALAVHFAIFREGVHPLTSTERPATPADVFFDNGFSGYFFGKYRGLVSNLDDPAETNSSNRETWVEQKSVPQKGLISAFRSDNFGATRASEEEAGKRHILIGKPVADLSVPPKNATFPEDGVCEPKTEKTCCGC
jgi:hypothetical protein